MHFVWWFCVVTTLTLSSSFGYYADEEVLPEFYSPLENMTVSQGRDIHFTCVVNHLGNYRVAWIKSDSKAILAIHNRLVAHNPRLSVTHNGHNTWKLHVYNIQRNDSGTYMCQVNTDPMRSQLGYLNVTVPPDILNDEEGTSYQDLEGGTIQLRCRATGDPEPEVTWKREDGQSIVLRTDKATELHDVVAGENLTLNRVNRSDMGTYLCIARSSVPPIVSKRYSVRVNFKPVVEVKNQLVAAPMDSHVTIHCIVEASPRATFQWLNNRGETLITGIKESVQERQINEYTVAMDLTINSLRKDDFGEYTCVSENTIGRAEGKVRLQELYLPQKTTSAPKIKGDDGSMINRKNKNILKPTKTPSVHDKNSAVSFKHKNQFITTSTALPGLLNHTKLSTTRPIHSKPETSDNKAISFEICHSNFYLFLQVILQLCLIMILV